MIHLEYWNKTFWQLNGTYVDSDLSKAKAEMQRMSSKVRLVIYEIKEIIE